MDKQQARKIITETFENPFDKGRFTDFIKNLLNRIDVESSFSPRQGQYIPEKFRDFVSKYERIGKYSDGEKRIDILVVYLSRKTSIERARSSQRNFIAEFLQGKFGGINKKDAALVAYVSPDQADWRFSLVKMDYKFETTAAGRVKVKEDFTPARRWSFLVGANEKSHTAQSRLVNILANDEQAPTLAELENAFDIETVTKEFFLQYRELFLRTKEALDKVVEKDPKIKADFEAKGVDTVNFSKKLLGQIVFLYFLQKKGWFGVGRDDDWGTGSKHFLRSLFAKKHGDYKNFFNDILEPLFYDALSTDRSDIDHWNDQFKSKIPFLNGGLFDPIGNYSWYNTDILLPNDLFSNARETKQGDEGDGILDVFDRYNFTVREDEPLEKEVAIDPELLGKAYEKFNAIRPDNFDEFTKALKSGKKGEENKFNKKFGVYYTPREIVHYMCKQSLINHLFTRVEEAKLSGAIKKQDIEVLIEVGELITEHEVTALIKQEKIKNGSQKSSKYKPQLADSIRKNATTIDQWLEEITVCDPAVGSGAFPVGMMNEILRARNVLSVFLKEDGRSDYEFKRRCIEHSLYGVDIDPGAVEIAKLRLWLSLVVEEEDIRNIKPLPNLDYRIMQGNSLISEFMGINFDADENKNRKERISALETEEKEINIKIKEKEKEQVQFYNMHHKQDVALSNALNELTKNNEKIRNEIKKTEKEIEKEKEAQESTELSELLKIFQQKKDEFLNESNVSRKAMLKEQVDNLLIEIFESKLKKEKADFFNRLENIRNKYSVLPNEKQRNDIIKQEEAKLYNESGFDLEAAENQLKEFTSGRQIKPFFLWNLYFSEAFHAKGGFDVVIANPPYIQLQKDGGTLSEMFKKCGYATFERTGDIYALFYEQGANILRHHGVLCFITSNKWMRAGYGKSLRIFFLKHNPRLLIDLGPGIFESATVDTNILIMQKSGTKPEPLRLDGVTLTEDAKDAGISSYIKRNRTRLTTLSDNAWFIGSATEQRLKEKIERIGKPFKDWDVNIYRGVLTGLNEAFIIDTPTKERLCAEDPKSADILKPILRGRDIKRYHYDWKGLWVIASGYDIDLPKNYPAAFRHLKEFEEKAKKRDDKGQNWWNLRACAYYPEFEKEKVVWTDIATQPIFTILPSNIFFNNTIYMIVGDNIKTLTGMLNSQIIKWYFPLISTDLGNKGQRFFKIFVEIMPIPPITPANQPIASQIEALVDSILAAKKDNPQANTQEQERQIDQMVYQLYDLTEEEIRIVEGEA